MGSDRSLDDFLPDETDADGRSDDGEAERAERDGSEPADTEPSTGDGENVEVAEDSEPPTEDSETTVGGTDTGSTVGDATMADPAVSTATWTTDGAACERCDDVVKRRWLDDGKRVCSACKEW